MPRGSHCHAACVIPLMEDAFQRNLMAYDQPNAPPSLRDVRPKTLGRALARSTDFSGPFPPPTTPSDEATPATRCQGVSSPTLVGDQASRLDASFHDFWNVRTNGPNHSPPPCGRLRPRHFTRGKFQGHGWTNSLPGLWLHFRPSRGAGPAVVPVAAVLARATGPPPLAALEWKLTGLPRAFAVCAACSLTPEQLPEAAGVGECSWVEVKSCVLMWV